MSARSEVVAEWRRGSWHVSPSPAGPRVVMAALESSWLGEDDSAEGLILVLPREVQRHLDLALGFDSAGCVEAALASRRTAALLLRSKRMHDDDIARCLGLPTSDLPGLLTPQVRT